MNKRAVNISSLVILLSLLCFIMEVCIYYFIPQHWVAVVFSVICSLILSHFFLESSLNYDYNFIHASFMVITSLAFAIIIYIIQPNMWISYDFSMVFLVLLNWLVPFLYCCTRDLLDRGPRFDGFHLFFNRMCIFFIVIYILAILKQYFITPIVPPYSSLTFGAHDFVPFMATAEYIEKTLNAGKSLMPIILYILELVFIGIPFGYFARVYLNRLHFLIQLFIYLFVPFVLEFLQAITGIGRGDIDDYVIFLLGAVIGIVIYQIMCRMFISVANRELTVDRNKRNTKLSF